MSQVCPHCRLESPDDSTFCPMCGTKLGLGGGDDTTPEAVSPAQLVDEPGPAPGLEPVFERVLEPVPASAGSVVRPAPTAPGPSAIPLSPSPVRIGFGAVFVAIAAWLLAWLVPRHPLGDAGEVTAKVTGAVLAAGGLALVVWGALYRAQAETRCRRCKRPVVAWKGALGLQCPLGAHYARVSWFWVALVIGFWLVILGGGGLVALWLR